MNRETGLKLVRAFALGAAIATGATSPEVAMCWASFYTAYIMEGKR